MITRDLDLVSVATIVSEELRRDHIDPILVGGSALTAYEPELYVSRDADFVTMAENASLTPAMERLGFSRVGNAWTHPETEFTVQFVSGSPMVGAREIRDFKEITNEHGRLKTLELSDVVADRLLKFLVWDDREAGDLALQVLEKTKSLDAKSILTSLESEVITAPQIAKLQLLKKRAIRSSLSIDL